MSLDNTLTATTESKLPDATGAGFADKLYRLDGGHSLANDGSVWTPGENVGRSIEFSSTCWLIQRGKEWLLWDTGVPESALNDPKGWSTLPKLIVYQNRWGGTLPVGSCRFCRSPSILIKNNNNGEHEI